MFPYVLMCIYRDAYTRCECDIYSHVVLCGDERPFIFLKNIYLFIYLNDLVSNSWREHAHGVHF